MSVSIQLTNCKCGVQKQFLMIKKGGWVLCANRKWSNFWKHDKPTQHVWYP